MSTENDHDACMCCRADFVAFENKNKCSKCGHIVCNECTRFMKSDDAKETAGATSSFALGANALASSANSNIICKDCEFMGEWVRDVKEKDKGRFWNLKMPKIRLRSFRDTFQGPKERRIPNDVQMNLASLSREKLKELHVQKEMIKTLQAENEKMRQQGSNKHVDVKSPQNDETIAELQNQVDMLVEQNDKLREMNKSQALAQASNVSAAPPAPDASQNTVAVTKTRPPAPEDPKLAKYRRMQKAGLPEGAITNASARDNVQLPADFFNPAPAEVSVQPPAEVSVQPPPEDPKFAKYRRMQKAGLPEGAIMNASAMDKVLLPDNFFTELVPVPAPTPQPTTEVVAEIPLPPEDPKFAKYRKMQTAGLPEGAIINASKRDNVELPGDFFTRGSSQKIPVAPPLPGSTSGDVVAEPVVQVKSKYETTKRSNIRDDSAKPLRGIFWNVLPANRVENSWWVKMNDSPPFDLASQFKVLDEKFAKLDAKKIVTSQKSNDQSPVERETIFDSKRQQHLDILLAYFKEPPSVIRKKIISMDNSFFTMETVHKLISVVPTPEESEKLRAVESSCQNNASFLKSLSPSEILLYELSKVPRLRQRLQAMFVEMSFQRQCSSLEEQLAKYELAIRQLNNCSDWRQLLHLVLVSGNYLNSSNARTCGAWGIECSTALQKLSETKSADDSKYSLLHWLAEVIVAKAPNLLQLESRLDKLASASTLEINELKSDIDQIVRGCTLVEREVEACEKNEEAVGAKPFVATMKPFLENTAKEEILNLQAALEQVQREANDLLENHGEVSSRCSCGQLMSTALTFIKAIVKASEENKMREMASKKKGGKANGIGASTALAAANIALAKRKARTEDSGTAKNDKPKDQPKVEESSSKNRKAKPSEKRKKSPEELRQNLEKLREARSASSA